MRRPSITTSSRQNPFGSPLRHILGGLALSAAAVPVASADLTITITGIEEPGGMIHWAVFDSPETYAGDGAPVIAARSRVADAGLSATVHGLSPGRYAVRLFHDSNGNGELDRNVLGIPSEAYGFSNDAGARGPASFEEAAVVVEGNARIEVRLR